MKRKAVSAVMLTLLLASMLAFEFNVQPVGAHKFDWRVRCMPDLGQHSMQWCWVAAAANYFYWLKHYGGFPSLYPDSWDEIDPDSQDPNNSTWYCGGCGNGYMKLLKEICKYGRTVHEKALNFCDRFFEDPWWDYVDPYVSCLEEFIADQGFNNTLYVYTYADPAFGDYNREIERNHGVIILYQWGGPQDIHLVTGYSYNTGAGILEVSDPGRPLPVDHNNDPNLKNYTRWEVTSEDPFEANSTYTVRYLFCVSPYPRTWSVDDDGAADFSTIQGAINAAWYGDTIYVHNGLYYEHVIVNKTLDLVGENREYTIIDGNYTGTGHIISVERVDNVVIRNFTVQNSGRFPSGLGIRLYYADNCTITGNNIANNGDGIRLIGSRNNTLADNYITWCYRGAGSIGYGIYIKSDNNTVSRNNLVDNEQGIYLYGTVGNLVLDNNMTKNNLHASIVVWYGYDNVISGNNIVDGNIALTDSRDNTVSENYITHNTVVGWGGIGISHGSGNTVYGNNIYTKFYTSRGIHLNCYSYQINLVYHNNLINCGALAELETVAIWDDGYPSGGNYWSTYSGTDLYSGPYQNETGSDGIGDTPHVIDELNIDNYPLMNPWTGYKSVQVPIKGGENATITSNVTITKALVTKNTLHFDASGPAGLTGWINVTFPMVNTTDIKVFINKEKLTPPPFPIITTNGTHYFIYFEFALSTHNIIIQYAILGDVNGDGIVDVNDLARIGKAYGTTSYSPAWDEHCDITGAVEDPVGSGFFPPDGRIDAYDLAVYGENYGKS